MTHRCLAAVLTVIAVVALTPIVAAAQSTALSRTPWGTPDLQGVWDFRTVTPLERPDEFEGKEFLTAEEAAEFEQKLAATRVDRRPDEGNTGTLQSVLVRPGNKRGVGQADVADCGSAGRENSDPDTGRHEKTGRHGAGAGRRRVP